jgi:hypothetical protein
MGSQIHHSVFRLTGIRDDLDYIQHEGDECDEENHSNYAAADVHFGFQ